MFSKYYSIRVSERVFDILADYIDTDEFEGYLQTFNNCREQGYYLAISKKNYKPFKQLYIWAFECRNSDNIVVITSHEIPDNGMFDEEAYKNRKLFRYNGYFEACDYIKKIIENEFKEEVED